MKRASPFENKLVINKDNWIDPEKIIEYVSNAPKGKVPNIVIVYNVGDKRHTHMTMLFKVISTTDISLVLKLYKYIEKMFGDEILFQVKEKADFSSHIYPESKIMRVRPNWSLKQIAHWSAIFKAMCGYDWKPHITFKDGKIFDIDSMKLELWIGYMRLDRVTTSGKSILTVVSPLERQLAKHIQLSDKYD
jgi:hypothetical protein